METIVILTKLKACEEALKWAEAHPDPSEAWNSCDRIDWMFWLLSQNGANLDAIVELACDNTIHALAALPEPQGETKHICEDLIAVVRRFMKGTATKTELSDTRSAAESSAESSAWFAVRSAARSARSAARSAAESVVESAVFSAARSARSAWFAVRSAAESAGSAETQWQCDHLRERFSAVDVLELLAKKE